MELVNGRCTLCSCYTRILPPSECKRLSTLIADILPNEFLNEEFVKIEDSIRICPLCCCNIEFAVAVKEDAKKANEGEELNVCYFCKSTKGTVKIQEDWSAVNRKIQIYTTIKDFPIISCIKCLQFYHIADSLRHKVAITFPKTIKNPEKTKKRKTFSTFSRHASKKKSSCFQKLKALSRSNYRISKTNKKDNKLCKMIPYVNLTKSSAITIKSTPKTKPVIKIKLLAKGKREQKHPHASKCEEAPRKGHNTKKRRLSETGAECETSAINETPKSAINSSFVPKRRVSDYLHREESNDTPKEKSPEIEESKTEITADEEVKEKSDDEVPVESHEVIESEKPVEPAETPQAEEPEDTPQAEEPEDTPQAEEPLSPPEKSSEEKVEIVNDDEEDAIVASTSLNGTTKLDLDDTSSETVKSSSKDEICNEAKPLEEKVNNNNPNGQTEEIVDLICDSDSNVEVENNASESDSCNESDRKKKKVTFSDDIDD